MFLPRENSHNGNFWEMMKCSLIFNMDAFLHFETGISGLIKFAEFKEKSVILKWQKNMKDITTEAPSPPKQEAGTEWEWSTVHLILLT